MIFQVRLLIRQTSESLAGRIAFYQLGGFRPDDVGRKDIKRLWLWLRGWGVEFKFTDAPTVTRSMRIALADLELEHLWVVHPGEETYRPAERITVLPLGSAGETIRMQVG